MNRIRIVIIQPKDRIDDLGVTTRQQVWIVRLSTEADDGCAILTFAPHTYGVPTFASSKPMPRCVPEIRQSPSAISVVYKSGSSFIDTVADVASM